MRAVKAGAIFQIHKSPRRAMMSSERTLSDAQEIDPAPEPQTTQAQDQAPAQARAAEALQHQRQLERCTALDQG